MTEQQDTGRLPSWPEMRAFAAHAESLGVHSLWVFDHFYALGDSPIGAVHEAWSVQSALAAVTSRVELGQLVMCSSFRNPALLAKMAVTVDGISGGRLTLGLGAGWYDREYEALGVPADHRLTRFAEATDITLSLLRGATVTAHGRYHQAGNAVLNPTPERRIPVLIAGKGPRMREVIARHADAWNTAWYEAPDDRLATRLAEMRSTLDAAGRAHSSLRWTVGMAAGDMAGAAYAEAVTAFAGLGVDDLIVSTQSAALASLDRLAVAAAPFL
jgi:probable F420-dependent oxidoreductase